MFQDLSDIHKLSYNNKEDVLKSKKAACFHCLKKFNASEVISFKKDKHAVCPKCEKDCVIGDRFIKNNFVLTLNLDKKLFVKLNEMFDTNVELES